MELNIHGAAITAEEITAGYRNHTALSDISVSIMPGMMLGILGPNGCGKTTLLRVLRGTLTPRSGKVRWGERPLSSVATAELARSIAFLPQEISLDLAFTVRELVMMGRSPHIARFARESARDREIAIEAMQQADVEKLADRPVTTLSGGERRRAVLAMCVAQQPKVLLLDEPTNHLDLGRQVETLELLDRLRCEKNMAIAAVFHDWNLAAEYCQQLLVLDGGRHVAFGPPDDILTNELLHRLYGVSVDVQTNPKSGKPFVMLLSHRTS